MRRVAIIVLALAAVASGCGSSDEQAGAANGPHRLFGDTEPLSDVVGTDIVSSHVVPMRCIPARTDPVGVFLGLEIVDWSVDADQVTVSIRTNHARLGSHPSGCSDPALVMQDSMFLLGPGDEAVHATNAIETADGTTLVFDLDGRSSDAWSAVLLPTVEYALRNGDRQTSIFGFVGHYDLM